MEKHSRERSGVLKSALVAGLISLAGGKLEAQNFGNWLAVESKQEFEQLHIPEDMIQRVDANQDSIRVDSDHSKAARTYTDRSGRTYYWINKSLWSQNLTKDIDHRKDDTLSGLKITETDTAETKTVSGIEAELDEILNNPEMKEIIEGFKSHFKISLPYAIDPETGKKFDMVNHEQYVNPPDIIKDYENGQILYGSSGNKEVLIQMPKIGEQGPDLSGFIYNLYLSGGDIRYLISWFLIQNDKSRLTIEEKIKFLKPFFTTEIEDALRDLPQYDPPRFKKPEYKPDYKGDSSETPSEREGQKENEVNMTEEELKRLLEEKTKP